MSERRVVITGLGVVSPVGHNPEEVNENIKSGKSGIAEITRFDTEEYKVKLAAEVKDFNPDKYLDHKETKRNDLFSVYALYSACQAYENSKIDGVVKPERLGVVFGSGIGGLQALQDNISKFAMKGPKRVSPLFIPTGISNMAAGNIAIKLNAKASCTATTTACAAGTHALIDAFRLIKDNRADAVIAGGSEASIVGVGVAGFANMTALTSSTDVDRASIPFDKERSGFVIGEGSATLIVEDLDHAIKRGAKIYAEVIGYGSTCDAYHITAPSKDGAIRAMREALETSNLDVTDIDYINAHGTSTELNDKNEVAAIKEVFGSHAYNLHVSSTKSMTGHLLGGAGALEALICAKALEEGYLPPTINYKVQDEDMDLNFVPNKRIDKEITYAMSNSLGFGGHNAVVILKRWTNE